MRQSLAEPKLPGVRALTVVVAGGTAHGTLPWTLEGKTRTTLFYKFNTNGSSWTRNYLVPDDFGESASILFITGSASMLRERGLFRS